MRIGDLAARAGVSVRSLRYYEEQGLLTSTRSAGGQRHYTESDVERVAFVQRLYAAGLSSRTLIDMPRDTRCFKSGILPHHTVLPLSSTTAFAHTASASSMLWVVNKQQSRL